MAVPLRSAVSRSPNFLEFASRFDLPSSRSPLPEIACGGKRDRRNRNPRAWCHPSAASPGEIACFRRSGRLIAIGGRGKMAQKPVRSPLRPSPPTPALPSAAFPETRRGTLIIKEPEKPGARLAEVAGSTAAGCAALCCCPCGVANLIVAVLKLPAGLVRRWRRRCPRGAKTKPSIWRPEVDAFYDDDDDDDYSLYLGRFPLASSSSSSEEPWPAKSPSPEFAELEKEMLAKFYGTGFWRSLSQRSA